MQTKNILSALLVISLSVVSGCSNKLDKETAAKILTQEKMSSGVIQCTWTTPSLKTATGWTYMDFDEHKACAAQLQQAGLATLGECLNSGYRTCYERVIKNTEKSTLNEEESGLTFDCGTIKLIGITSIITKENKATVKYNREVSFDSNLMAKLSACKLHKPDEGIKERERSFLRNDAGDWLLDKK